MNFRMGLLVGGLGVAVVALGVVVIVLVGSNSDGASRGDESCPVARAGQPAEVDLSRSSLDCIESKAVLGEYETVIAQQPTSSPGDEATVDGWHCESIPLAGFPALVNCRSTNGDGFLEVKSTAPYPAGAAHPPGPTAADEEANEAASKPDPVQPVYFQTPSGNIVCSLSRQNATCEIFHKGYTPYVPRPPSCQLGYGHRLSVGAFGPAEFDCYGDSMQGIAKAALGYGREIRRGRIGCLSEEEGLICETVSGTGFLLSAQHARLL